MNEKHFKLWYYFYMFNPCIVKDSSPSEEVQQEEETHWVNWNSLNSFVNMVDSIICLLITISKLGVHYFTLQIKHKQVLQKCFYAKKLQLYTTYLYCACT